VAATWGTPTTWADFLTWAGDTAAPTTTPASTSGGFYTPPRRAEPDVYLTIAVLDDDIVLI